tara:strand:- start:239 stop:496 length:258 start_codon:yes stop_codon:yes gene_type:complete
MTKEKIKIIIIKLIEKISKIKVKKDIKNKNFNYFEMGLIDSLNLIKFIFELENFFKISFSQKDILSKKFKNIDNLIIIILNNLKK